MVQYQAGEVTVFESALFRTTTTVLITGDLVLVVDPNWLPHEIKAIKQWIAPQLAGKKLYLLFTHSDYDHIIGYQAFPGAVVIASKAFADNPNKAVVVEEIKQFDDDYYIQRDYSIIYPNVDIAIDTDGQTLQFGTTTLTFYLAPGHNHDGIFTIVETQESRNDGGCIWIAGDYFSNVEFPYIYFSWSAYKDTLANTNNILNNHAIRLLIPGHGDVAIGEDEIIKRQQSSMAYLNELEQHAINGAPLDMDKLWEQYHFPRSMAKFHEKNVELVKKELLPN